MVVVLSPWVGRRVREAAAPPVQLPRGSARPPPAPAPAAEPDAAAARAQVNGMLLEGKKVFVGPFQKRAERPADKDLHFTNIFVKNLADNVTEEQLEKLFGEHGAARAQARPKFLYPPYNEDAWIVSQCSRQHAAHLCAHYVQGADPARRWPGG